MSNNNRFKYLISGDYDHQWGITVDTVGEYCVEPDYDIYPPRVGHPEDYYFDVCKGRILDSYLLVYISQGRGWFCETSEKRVEITSGSAILLSPYTWHSYYPDRKTGWQEYWISFRGRHMDERFRNGFFTKDKTIYKIGFREEIINQYKEAIDIAIQEKPGYQQILAAIGNGILANTIYYDRNSVHENTLISEKIDLARNIMREEMLTKITPEEIAERINMSYSWFRKTFKEYTNVSPAHYMTQLKLQKAKSLLVNSLMSVKEISFLLNYEDTAYFSAVFKKHVGCSPSEYRAVVHE